MTPEEEAMVNQLLVLVKAMGWQLAVRSDADILCGIIVGTPEYVKYVLSELE